METKKQFKPDFIQIPIQLIDDRDLEQLDRLLYGIIYWYEHLKDGHCYASNKTLADMLHSTIRAIQNSLNQLENKGYIERKYKDESQRHRKEIIAKIAFRRLRTVGDRQEQSEPQFAPERTTVHSTERTTVHQIKNSIVKNNKEESLYCGVNAAESKQKDLINILIDRFKGVNPNHERLFSNTTQRKAMERLVKKHDPERLGSLIDALPKLITRPFYPKITTPYELEMKMGSLLAKLYEDKSKSPLVAPAYKPNQ